LAPYATVPPNSETKKYETNLEPGLQGEPSRWKETLGEKIQNARERGKTEGQQVGDGVETVNGRTTTSEDSRKTTALAGRQNSETR